MCVYLGGELRRKRLAEGIPYHPEVGILQTRLVFVSVVVSACDVESQDLLPFVF